MQLKGEFQKQRREDIWKFTAHWQGLNEGDIWVLNKDIQIHQHGNLLADW